MPVILARLGPRNRHSLLFHSKKALQLHPTSYVRLRDAAAHGVQQICAKKGPRTPKRTICQL